MVLALIRRALGALAAAAVAAALMSGAAVAESPAPGTDTTFAVPSDVVFGSILPVVRETGQVSLSTDGLGMLGASGTVEVAKPSGATVRSAYLAAASTGVSGYRIPSADIQIDGQALPSWIYETPTSVYSWNYWADVTPLVKPKVDAAAPGRVAFTVGETNTLAIDGTILTVIFDDPNQPPTNTVVLFFGAQAVSGDSFGIQLAKPFDKSQPDLRLQMSLGISYGFQPAGQYSFIDVNGFRVTSSAGGQDDGASGNGALLTVGGLDDSDANPLPYVNDAAGPRTDDEFYNLLPFVRSGDTRITVTTGGPSGDDNIFFSSLFLRGVAPVMGEAMALTPSAATVSTGSSHTLTATVRDQSGSPVANRSITFQVLSGPNAGITQTGVTGASGQAAFAYTSMAAGTDVVKARFLDPSGVTQFSNGAVVTWEVTNRAPVCRDDAITFPEDTAYTGDLSALCSDPDGDPLQIELVSTGLAGVSASPTSGVLPGGQVTLTPAADFSGDAGTFAYRAADPSGGTSSLATAAVTVAPVNDPPAVTAENGGVSVSEGETAVNAGSFADIDSSSVAVSASVGTVVQESGSSGRWTWSYSTRDDAADSRPVTITATDSEGASTSVSFDLAVSNVAPTLGSISGMPAGPVPAGTSVTLSAPYSDPGTADTQSAEWMLSGETVSGDSASGTASLSYNLAEPGVYRVALTVTDDDGGSDRTESTGYIVVYDAAAGFVTGGGWIISPAGACPADPSLTGKASFGFVSKYRSGAAVPSGETQFLFQAAGLKFHSTIYDWLVVSGSKAQFKGTGAIDGRSGEYSFMLTAIDGGAAGDAFRIKITDGATVVYDNQIGRDEVGRDATQISGGSIMIHR